MYEETKAIDFRAMRLKLASPDDIHRWSFGEVTRPETINYRTQKPEKDGLFDERIFGPTKDWECYCGKYKRIRYKGIVCDKCGVEVTRSVVRRERMGHIDLAAPVSHIWFLRGVPSKIGLVLDLSVQDLEKVIYFANFIVISVSEERKAETLKQIDQEFDVKKRQIDQEYQRAVSELKQKRAKTLAELTNAKERQSAEVKAEAELTSQALLKNEQVKTLEGAVEVAKKELRELEPLQIISEAVYRDLSLKYGHVFDASIGAEAIHKLLKAIDFDVEIARLSTELVEAPENKKRRLIRRLRLLKSLKNNSIRPEWTILTTVPVIPPDLRPMVQLDGGRFATSDLNDLYRRVINRNNRLKRLLELNAPEVITRNEKRMLQEAVDALIDNGARHGKTVTASTGQKRMLKSIADMLKGKQGRFRQNLLGKRVDYSGRSVIVIGPYLKLHQCGLPKRMALELFRPFVISKLIKRELVHNVRSAGRYIEAGHPEIWDILEEVTKNAHVLLNRAPTLHRLGIQAFQPILIEGKAIQIHPMVCPAFNADFDGDQMAVHVPLTEKAKEEAAEIMLSSKNLLKPAVGTPVVSPQQDIVLGCYYLTQTDNPDGPMKAFISHDEAVLAYESRTLGIQTLCKVLMDGKIVETSAGRIIFNRILPPELGYVNSVMDKKTLSALIGRSFIELGNERTVELLDAVKHLAFKYLTLSGLSWGMDDLPHPAGKAAVITGAEHKIDDIRQHYEEGLLTDDERRAKSIEVWATTKDEVTSLSQKALDLHGPVHAMIASGARGSWAQITQMMGMKGLVTNPSGETIELPVKGSFKEGFDVLEYFISTHGTRKGLSDTALRTANAGYLTRRLIDVAQDNVIQDEDCGDEEGMLFTKAESKEMGLVLADRIAGRVLLEGVKDLKTKRVAVKAGTLITETVKAKLTDLDPEEARIRSILTCKAKRGLCRQCYGYDLSYNKLVAIGTAAGIMAAQSIGEPGTQLTMRTFHTGGVAGQDITQGLPRVEELFEARPVKKAAIMSDVAGQVDLEEGGDHKVIVVNFRETVEDRYEPAKKRGKKAEVVWKVKDGATIDDGDVLYERGDEKVPVKLGGKVHLKDNVALVVSERDGKREYSVPAGFMVWVKRGDLVNPGDQLTEGTLNLYELFRLKGREAVQKYITKEILYVYTSQGQPLNEKHIEVIVRQMFSRVYVKDEHGADLLAGEIVDRTAAELENARIEKKGGTPADLEPLLLGITKASLSTDSFLSAASFQETARVLIDAAISGKVDSLRGLKENVIIGKLIPAGTGFRKIEAEKV